MAANAVALIVNLASQNGLVCGVPVVMSRMVTAGITGRATGNGTARSTPDSCYNCGLEHYTSNRHSVIVTGKSAYAGSAWCGP